MPQNCTQMQHSLWEHEEIMPLLLDRISWRENKLQDHLRFWQMRWKYQQDPGQSPIKLEPHVNMHKNEKGDTTL